MKIILASQSPRRKELLEAAGVPFTVRASHIDEQLSDELKADPARAVCELAQRKAATVVQEIIAEQDEIRKAAKTSVMSALAQGRDASDLKNPEIPRMEDTMVIGADTIVVCNGVIFGKPANLSEGKHMLRELSGTTHQVMTGVSAWGMSMDAEGKIALGHKTFYDVTDVTFHELTEEQIADYLRLGESFDKAGAYAIQGEGAKLVDHYDGSLDTVIGLPVEALLTQFPGIADEARKASK